MQKLFYLGGLGTLHGYRHKEFMGSRFWMLNSEYRIDFPRSDLAASLSWDVGQVSADSHFGIEDEVRHSLGASLYFGNDLKLTVARRLDGAKDDDPKFYVRLAHVFRPRLTFSN
jgi:hemolysin activation/secretion protein